MTANLTFEVLDKKKWVFDDSQQCRAAISCGRQLNNNQVDILTRVVIVSLMSLQFQILDLKDVGFCIILNVLDSNCDKQSVNSTQ